MQSCVAALDDDSDEIASESEEERKEERATMNITEVSLTPNTAQYREHVVIWSERASTNHEGMPLPDFLCSTCPSSFATMTAARRVIRRRQIKVNLMVASCATTVHVGDTIECIRYASSHTWSSDQCARRARVENLMQDIEVLHEDSHLVAFMKPAGVLVHPPQCAHDVGEKTMQDLGLAHGALGAVHRLDRSTSGVLLFAKSVESIKALQATWNEPSCTSKIYISLVQGTPTQHCWIVNSPLQKPCMAGDKGRKRRSEKNQEMGSCQTLWGPWAPLPASTFFQVVSGGLANGYTSLIACRLEHGGRTHQIRRHLQMCGHPVVGDDRYGAASANRFMKKHFSESRLFLHAHRLRIRHPSTNDTLDLEAPLPSDFITILQQLKGGVAALQALKGAKLQLHVDT